MERTADINQTVHKLYQDLPYPADDSLVMSEGAMLPPLDWLGAIRPNQQLNSADSRILVAGCGSGAEAFRYSLACPEATVVAVDFSERSIEVANKIATKNGFSNISFAVADLTDRRWVEQHNSFDFISLHGVIDYIPDAGAAFKNLSAALKPDGCLYAGVNGPGHPNVKYRKAFPYFEVTTDKTEFSRGDREKLSAIEVLMHVPHFDSVASASEPYLASDVFTSQNHSLHLSQWEGLTTVSGLHLLTSFELPALIPVCPPQILKYYLPHSRAALTRIACEVQDKSFMRLLFTKEQPSEPPWTDINSLANWTPIANEKVQTNLPKPKGPWEELTRVPIFIESFGQRGLFLSPASCDFVRRCDGTQTAIELWSGLPQLCDWDTLVIALFSMFHAGQITWQEPQNDARGIQSD